jgi:hypothetical protein
LVGHGLTRRRHDDRGLGSRPDWTKIVAHGAPETRTLGGLLGTLFGVQKVSIRQSECRRALYHVTVWAESSKSHTTSDDSGGPSSPQINSTSCQPNNFPVDMALPIKFPTIGTSIFGDGAAREVSGKANRAVTATHSRKTQRPNLVYPCFPPLTESCLRPASRCLSQINLKLARNCALFLGAAFAMRTYGHLFAAE